MESATLFLTGAGGPGFVVSYVPESDTKPLRCELLENKPYMLRVGDQLIPSSSILSNLLYPKSSPQLQLSVRCEWDPLPPTAEPVDIEFRYRLIVRNTGSVSASGVFIVPATIPTGLPFNCPYQVTKTETEFGDGIHSPAAIQPLSRKPVAIFRQRAGTRPGGNGFAPRSSIAFRGYFQVFANDMLPTKQQVVIADRAVDLRSTVDAITVAEFDSCFAEIK